MPDSPVAIVTAAGRGIGEAIARELAARGYSLALMSPSGASTRLAQELGGLGMDGSVTEQANIDRLVAATLDRYGHIDALVNNTGRHAQVLARHRTGPATATGPAALQYDPDDHSDPLAVPDAAWSEDFDLLVLNCMRTARAVTPHLLERGGAIVNISGMEAAQPRLAYPLGPVRLALHGFTKIYADRYARHGIRMNCLLPGMIENADRGDPAMHRAIPMGRYGQLTEIARTAAFLLSADAGYITGQMIVADGGLNRGI